jgi:branched-subunit amino acid aminotransferase/4-amino-4-deoxychorismate lyase
MTDLSISWKEDDFGSYELVTADEAFYTATSFAIMPCTKINGQLIGTGQPGPLTQKLIALWSDMVGLDIVAQADEYAEKVKRMEF